MGAVPQNWLIPQKFHKKQSCRVSKSKIIMCLWSVALKARKAAKWPRTFYMVWTVCNGTRLVVKTLMQHIIEATIITGQFSREDVYIPKIPLCPSDYPFEFKRLQFPVKLSFAMSINKAHGQSIKSVGIHLEPGCFSHGQLYVGCSWVSSQKDLYILASNAKTKNIVYKKALC